MTIEWALAVQCSLQGWTWLFWSLLLSCYRRCRCLFVYMRNGIHSVQWHKVLITKAFVCETYGLENDSAEFGDDMVWLPACGPRWVALWEQCTPPSGKSHDAKFLSAQVHNGVFIANCPTVQSSGINGENHKIHQSFDSRRMRWQRTINYGCGISLYRRCRLQNH